MTYSTKSSLGAELVTAIVFLSGGKEKLLQTSYPSNCLLQRDGNATLRSLSSAGAWKHSENTISLCKNVSITLV